MTGRSGVPADTVSDGREATPEERRALFRVVRGEPDDAELAALTVVLATTTSAPAPTARDRWSDPSVRFRTPLHPGPGGWKASAWPG